MLDRSDKLDNICEELHSKFSALGMNVKVWWSYDYMNSNPRNLEEYYCIRVTNEVKGKDYSNVQHLMLTIHEVILEKSSTESIVKSGFALLLQDLAHCV